MMQRKTLLALFAAPLVLLAWPAQAALRVFACEPEWGALVQELGGKLVDVSVATSALQDPHQIQAKPSLIARARNADLVVCTGAELEIGWLPVLLQQSGNARVQQGQPGNFAAADVVRKLDVPTQLDRAQGDVHAAGNPHIQTDPRNIAQVAHALAARLQQIDGANAAQYAQREADFTQRWQQAMARWTAQAAPLKGAPVVSQHKGYVYLHDWLGLKEVAVLEPKRADQETAAVQRAFAEKQRITLTALREIGVSFPSEPQGTFYAFVPHSAGVTSEKMTDIAAAAGVAVRPGTEYGPSGEGFVRRASLSDRGSA